jgi:GNAT superfamily N-acetyltransferase
MKALETRLYENVAAQYKLDVERRSQPGTTIIEDSVDRQPHDWCRLWTLDHHAYVQVHPVDAHYFHDLVKHKPADYRLTLDDIEAAYPAQVAETSREFYYVLDAARFTPFTPDQRYTVRRLTAADAGAFETFLARCTAEEKEAGDVSIDDEIGIAYGVLDTLGDGERIAAVASTYEYYGFIDVGILTDPDYRRQGLGKAAVSALSEQFLDKDELLLYRHVASNLGSMGIVRGLNYWQFAAMDAVKFKSAGQPVSKTF